MGAATLCVTALLAACAQTSNPPQASRSPASFNLDQLSGVIYVLAGPDDTTLDVHRIQLHPFKQTQVTHSEPHRGIDHVIATPRLVAATSADGGDDRVGRLLADGTVQPFPGFADPIAGLTQILPDGRIAYSARSYPYGQRGLPLDSEKVYDPTTQQTTVIVADDAGRHGWTFSPTSHDLAYATMSDARILHPDGSSTLLMKPIPRAVGLAWGPGNEIAVISSFDHPYSITLLRPDGSRVAYLSGWRAACWSPDGSALLVLRDDTGLYVWRPADDRQVFRIGSFPVGVDVAGATWTASDPLASASPAP